MFQKEKEQMSEEIKTPLTLEQRIMKSNLSDDDKIELIQRLNNSFPLPYDKPRIVPCVPNVPDRITTAPNTPPWWDTWYVTIC